MPRVKGGSSVPWAKQDHSLKGPWSFRAKEKVICVCEGGGFCDREDPAKQRGRGNAIPGLHSSWVGQDKCILAMARPWQAHVQQYHLVDAFLQNNIGMILNLQEVGEHASCGPGNLPSCGFTYSPDTFMAAGVGFYNFSWRDMGVPDLQKMMDIVQVMEYVTACEGRRVAVHCHAGLGRTGLAIACFLVYSQQYSAKRAVEEVRRDRQGALQTKKQEMFVYVFEQYISYLRCVYPPEDTTDSQPPPAPALSDHDAHMEDRASGQRAIQPAQEGKQRQKEEHLAGGLIVMRAIPAEPHAKRAKTPRGGRPSANDTMTPQELGLTTALPWTRGFDIIPDKYNREWRPHPPPSYQAALGRQQRLLHGHTRRAFLHLHRYVAEVVMALVGAAQAHQHVAAPAPAGPQLQRQPSVQPEQPAPATLQTRPSQQPAGDAQRMSAQSTQGQPATFEIRASPANSAKAQAVAESFVLLPLPAPAASRSYVPITHLYPTSTSGQAVAESRQSPVASSSVQHASTPPPRPKRSHRRVQPTGPAGPVCESTQPDVAVQGPGGAVLPATCFADALLRCADPKLRCIPGMLESLSQQPGYHHFTDSPQGSYTSVLAQTSKLQEAANCGDSSHLASAPIAVLVLVLEQSLGRMTWRSTALSEATLRLARDHHQHLPYEVDSTTAEPAQFLAASQLLDPLPPSDQELLLLFSALLRHVIRASGGPGCEEHVKGLCGWALRLLLGPQLRRASQEADEALTCLLWYLIRNDVAFGTLVLAKHRRLNGHVHKTLSASVRAAKGARAKAGAARNQVAPDPVSCGLIMPPLAQGVTHHHRENAVSVTSLDHVPMAEHPTPTQLAHSGQLRTSAQQGLPPPPPPPPGPPPASALSPAPPGPNHLLSAPTPASRGSTLAPLPGAPDVHGVAHVAQPADSPARPLRARTPEGDLDPRLYGGPAGAGQLPLAEGSMRSQWAPLKQQLDSTPTAHIPATTPGTQQISVHDVWM